MMPETAPQITTIIPTYRRPQMLARAIRSVLRQTYPHFQVCVYDNASGDETADVVAEIMAQDSRVKYHCHEANLGAFDNFEFGMAHVVTPFFNILADDDVLLPKYFETAMRGFDAHPDAMISAAATICVRGTRREVFHVALDGWARDGYFGVPHEMPLNSVWSYPLWMAIVYRRSVLESMGPLNRIHFADVDYHLRICARFPFVVSKEPGAVYVGHEGSSYQNSKLEHVWPSLRDIVQNFRQDDRIPPQVRTQMEPILVSNMAWYLLGFGVNCVRGERFQEAIEAANLLRNHYHRPCMALLLRQLVGLSGKWDVAHKAYAFGYDLWESIRGRFGEPRRLNEKYGRIAKEALLDIVIAPSHEEFVCDG